MNKKIKYESMFGNKNAEKWTIEEAEKLFQSALDLSYSDEFDFIGEIAKQLKTYRDIFVFLSDKFPELKEIYKQILNNLESNCFSHGKKGEINTAMAIVCLKSHHDWKDKTQNENTTTIELKQPPKIVFYNNNERSE